MQTLGAMVFPVRHPGRYSDTMDLRGLGMSLIVVPWALSNRLWARLRARKEGSFFIAFSKRSRCSVVRGCTGFDHGVGHPLLLLDDAKAPNYRKNKAFNDLDHYSEWPKVADAVIKAVAHISRSLPHQVGWNKLRQTVSVDEI
jgi:hypothetical protein